MIFVDSEPPDDHDRHRVGHIAPDAARRFRQCYGANRQGIIADHLPPGADHVRTRSTAFLIVRRSPSQPVVQRRLSAIKFREVVIRAQFLGRARRLLAPDHPYCSQGAFVFSSRRSLALLAGGLSSMDVKRLNSWLDKAK